MFRGVLDRPKKDQAAINSACLLTFTLVLLCLLGEGVHDAYIWRIHFPASEVFLLYDISCVKLKW